MCREEKEASEKNKRDEKREQNMMEKNSRIGRKRRRRKRKRRSRRRRRKRERGRGKRTRRG